MSDEQVKERLTTVTIEAVRAANAALLELKDRLVEAGLRDYLFIGVNVFAATAREVELMIISESSRSADLAELRCLMQDIIKEALEKSEAKKKKNS